MSEEPKKPFLFINDDASLETHTGYVYDPSITKEGLVEHYKSLLLDLQYIAKEYNKLFPSTSLMLYVIADCIKEGSVDEMAPYIESFLEEKTMRIQAQNWPYGRRKPKKG